MLDGWSGVSLVDGFVTKVVPGDGVDASIAEVSHVPVETVGVVVGVNAPGGFVVGARQAKDTTGPGTINVSQGFAGSRPGQPNARGSVRDHHNGCAGRIGKPTTQGTNGSIASIQKGCLVFCTEKKEERVAIDKRERGVREYCG